MWNYFEYFYSKIQIKCLVVFSYSKYHEILKPQSFQINILSELQGVMSERKTF